MRMTQVALVAIVVGIVVIVAYAGWHSNGPNRFEAAFAPGGTVELDLSAGGYTVQGTDGNEVRVRIDTADPGDVQSHIGITGAKAKVELDGPSNNFRATIYVPQRSDLRVDQTVGDLKVHNVIGDKHIGLGIGNLQIEVPAGAPLPNFRGGIVIGDLRANHWGVNKGGFFRSYSNRSGSAYSITAHVDIGELDLVESAPSSHPQQPDNARHHVPDDHPTDYSQ